MGKNVGQVSTPTVGQEVLDGTPERVIKFLRGVGTVPAIRTVLAAHGYTEEEHVRGWSLLQAASGYGAAAEAGTVIDAEVRDAIVALDEWDEDGFRIVRAALGRLHPEQARTVLEGLGPSVGTAAVLGVKRLLDRLDGLGKSKASGDHAALKTLAQRGLDDTERRRLRMLVEIAEEGTSTSKHEAEAAAHAARAAERQAALVELRAWFEDWSEMARASIKRRDRLILLGLAKRKSPAKAEKPAPTASPAPPSTSSAPAGTTA